MKVHKTGLISDIHNNKIAYSLMLPAIIFVFVFSYLPMVGIIIAFKNYNLMQGMASPWVGLENFRVIFTYPNMLLAIKNTLIYGAVILFGGFPFPIILALLLNELRNMRFKKTVQTMVYMPHFISWISVIGLTYTFLATEGPLNQFLAMIMDDYQPFNALTNADYFLPIIFLTHLWKSVGWSSVIFLAAIAGIDPTLYEAASIDGCGKLKQVLNITLPCIKTTVVIVLIMSLGSLVNLNFEQVYGFQNIYTQEQTEVINTLIYRQGIQNGKYSLATAFGLSQGLVMMFLVLMANAVSKKLSETSIW